MSAQLLCPNIKCKKILAVPEQTRGKIVRCSHCQTAFRVPVARDEAQPRRKSA